MQVDTDRPKFIVCTKDKGGPTDISNRQRLFSRIQATLGRLFPLPHPGRGSLPLVRLQVREEPGLEKGGGGRI